MASRRKRLEDCLISSFYIKPQPDRGDVVDAVNSLISSFYIKPQHLPQRFKPRSDCLISSFYIKPQPKPLILFTKTYCLISSFYIKPQPLVHEGYRIVNCLISSFYIKPQLYVGQGRSCCIALYRLSTSNHNFGGVLPTFMKLPYIVFLHQTTTEEVAVFHKSYCLISSFYIKPQLSHVSTT